MIGHWLGQDGDVFDFQIKKKIAPRQSLSVGLRYIREGIGGFDQLANYEGLLKEIKRREKILKFNYTNKINNQLSSIFKINLGQTWQKETGAKDNYLKLFYTIRITI
jgi:hypothetical protein